MVKPMMPRKARFGIVWSQFADYHCDRCDAIGQRLGERYDVLAVEVATGSQTYSWPASRPLGFARKQTLFPGAELESLSFFKRTRALLGALWGCQTVFIGIPYSDPYVIVTSWLLRLFGRRVVMMTDSKHDDAQRNVVVEVLKRLILLPYSAAIVSGGRALHYVRSLGIARQAVVPGYDVVSCERVERQAGALVETAQVAYEDRPFVFAGRFVPKKNLTSLVRAYAGYVARTKAPVRRLVLIGAGPKESQLRALIAELDIVGLVDFTGFLGSEEVARRMSGALALVLVSHIEQWGLVVNEAASLGLPAIVSSAVGASDALVRNLVNGYVVEASSIEAITRAMCAMAEDEARWRGMVEETRKRATFADVGRLADAVQYLLEPETPGLRERIELFICESAGGTFAEDTTLRSAARTLAGHRHANT